MSYFSWISHLENVAKQIEVGKSKHWTPGTGLAPIKEPSSPGTCESHSMLLSVISNVPSPGLNPITLHNSMAYPSTTYNAHTVKTASSWTSNMPCHLHPGNWAVFSSHHRFRKQVWPPTGWQSRALAEKSPALGYTSETLEDWLLFDE